MICQNSKLFLLFALAFFFLSLASLSALVCLTEAEYMEMGEIMTELDELATTSQQESRMLARELRLSENSLQVVSTGLIELQIARTEERRLWQEEKQYLQGQKRAGIWTAIFSGLAVSLLAFLIGGLVL